MGEFAFESAHYCQELRDRIHSDSLNLRLALEHLVREREDPVIWIDAMCINQSDDEEIARLVLFRA